MKRFVMGMLVLACLSLAAGAYAGIQTIDVWGEAPTPPLTPNVPWAQDLLVDKFNPELGTLMSVHVWICGEVYGDMGFEHTNPNGPTSFFDLTLKAQIDVTAPPGAGANFTTQLGRHEHEDNVPAFDGTIDYDGASGTNWVVSESDCTGEIAVDSSFFDQYIAAFPGEQLALPSSSIGLSTFASSTTNNKSFINTFAKGKVHIAYDYDPRVPEMGSLALASLGGFIGLPLFRRFRK